MHVRLASQGQHGRLTGFPGRGCAHGCSAALILTFVLAAFACGGPSSEAGGTSDPAVELVVSPTAPVAGSEAAIEIRLFDAAGRPVRGAQLQLEGHMEHPGMAPVIAPAVEQDDGAYIARVPFSMAGGWILFVAGELPDGRRIRERAGETQAVSPEGG
jgi:hypothetical protein